MRELARRAAESESDPVGVGLSALRAISLAVKGCAQGVVVVSVCMRMHRHTYTPIHACMYAYDGTANAVHRHTYTHAYMHTCMHTHMHAYIRLYSECGSPPYIHTCIHAHMHAYTHACIHTIVQRMRLTAIHTHMHTYTHAYIHTCMHTYDCTANAAHRVPSIASRRCALHTHGNIHTHDALPHPRHSLTRMPLHTW